MIDALIGGRLHGKPVRRVGASGKPFWTCRVRTPVGGDTVLFVSVITFSEQVGAALSALDDGDAVCLSGSLTPKVYVPAGGSPRPQLDLLAHAIVTAYHVQHKRQAVA